MAKINLAQQLATTLEQAGIKRIWGLTGDSLNGLTDALRTMDSIEWMHVRHEEVAAFAAGAEAAATGELTVCAGSCGPGNLHLINGLFDCHRNHVPVLAIAAQIPSSEIGLNYFQETHPQELFKECSHFIELVTNPEQMPHVLHRAMRSAILNRGVAVVVIPGDVSLLEVEDKLKPWPALHTPRTLPAEQDLQRLTEILESSKKVTLLCGSGCAGAHDQVVALADTLGAPVVHALRGKEHVEWDNPFDVGMTGLIGFSSGYHAMLDCDTLIMLGTDFPYRQFYPTDAKIIQVDRNPQALGRRATLDLGIAADVSETLDALLPRLTRKTDRSFLETSLKHYKSPPRPGRPGATVKGQPADPPAIRGAPAQRTGGRRCNLHRRRGLADRVGGALPEDEWQASPDRFVQPRLHGQCHAPGDRCPGGLSWAPGDLNVRRRRVCHADGGFHFTGAVEPARQSHRVR